MDALAKELQSRKKEIKKGLELLLKANVNITSWDVPEVDEKESARGIILLMKEGLDELQERYKK